MATKKNPTNKAEALRVSQLGDFKSRLGGILELPSGLVVKVKNPGGLQAFIANGTIPNSLLKIVQETLQDKKGVDEAKRAAELAKDLDSLGDMMRLLDLVASQVVKQPVCRMAPTQDDVDRHNMLFPENQVETPDELRDDENILYTDDIEEMDKQFLFQWVSGGTRDLESFRKKYEGNVAAVSAVSEPEATPELTDGADEG